MEEIDREVLATIAEDVLGPQLTDEVIAAARQVFDSAAAEADPEVCRRELIAVERQQARLTEAIPRLNCNGRPAPASSSILCRAFDVVDHKHVNRPTC